MILIPIFIFLHFYWQAYILLAAGGVLFFLLFLTYQHKVVDFFDAVDIQMEQMLSKGGEVRFPEVQDVESVFSRFVSKLTRLYDALRIARENEKRVMQGMVANMKMDLELLSSRQMEPKKQREFLERTMHQADKMDFLIQSIIKMSRLESGAIRILPQNAEERRRTPEICLMNLYGRQMLYFVCI